MAHEDILWPNETRFEWAKMFRKGVLNNDWFAAVIDNVCISRESEITGDSPGNHDDLIELVTLSSHFHEDALRFVLGPYYDNLAALVTVICKMKLEGGFPLSPLVSQKLTGASTPPLDATGRCLTYPFNVAPEWIRHNLNAWHNEDFHREKTKQKYFPFKYRDHLIHPITVWLIGKLLLENYYMMSPVLDAVRKTVVKDSSLRRIEQDLTEGSTINEIIAMIWRQKAMSDGNGSDCKVSNMTSEDVTLAWQDVALWHDAGYDPLFWCLTNSAEFSHCRIFDPNYVTERIGLCCENLLAVLPFADIPQKLHAKLTKIVKKATKSKHFDPYHLVWYIDDWRNQNPSSRVWGRSHALLSAHEFFEQHNKAESRFYPVALPALAIAEHHEDLYRGNDKLELASEFVRSPFGCVLRWADKLSVFPRLKMKWIPADSGEDKKIYPHLMQIFNYEDCVKVQMRNEQLICEIREDKEDDKNNKDKKSKTITSFLWGTVIEEN